jgi:hypothetical protein
MHSSYRCTEHDLYCGVVVHAKYGHKSFGGCVDRPFSTGGQLMCHEEMYRQMQYC